jgi:hypothetical protein
MAVSSPFQALPLWSGGHPQGRSSPRSRAGEQRGYRLIDARQQPHPHLDGLYESVEDALADAIGWLESMGPEAEQTCIGLEVSTPCGSWRTIRQPADLLCPLPRR